MDVSLVRLIIDSGLLVLIWIVQLIIYPSFLHYNSMNLVQWHVKYTSNFSYIVGPLMLGQLVIAILNVLSSSTIIDIVYLGLVLSTWFITFILFVPAHKKISLGFGNPNILNQLIRNNWIRTAIWTTIFALNFLTYLIVLE